MRCLLLSEEKPSSAPGIVPALAGPIWTGNRDSVFGELSPPISQWVAFHAKSGPVGRRGLPALRGPVPEPGSSVGKYLYRIGFFG